MITSRNSSNTLMIHSFKSKFLLGDDISINIDVILEETPPSNIIEKRIKFNDKFLVNINQDDIITFDDGLVQQIELIKLFDPKKNQIIFFPSFGLIRPDNILPNPIENSIAHSNKLLYLSTFMSSAEIWDLMSLKYKLGMHGWYHLNLNLNQDIDSLSTKERFKAIKDDAYKCVTEYYKFINPFINDYINNNILELYYCTPYNCYNELQEIYIGYLIKFIDEIFLIDISKKLIVFSHERIPIENFIKEIHNAIM